MAVPLMAKLDAAMLEKAHHLKVILQYGVGVEGVDIPAVSLFATASRPYSWLRFTHAELASLMLLYHTGEAIAMHRTKGNWKAMYSSQCGFHDLSCRWPEAAIMQLSGCSGLSLGLMTAY